VEVSAFDIQRIKNPEIAGIEYQNEEQKGFWNVREYVLYRDGHTCQHCKGRSKDPVLEVHHIETRQTGGDRPDNLITLCSTCHRRVSQGKLKLKVQPSKGFRAETFMTTVRWRLVNELKGRGNVVSHTYGYITKQKRRELGLEKSHSNDAFVIAGGKEQNRFPNHYLIWQVRKQNRKLFKGKRSHIRNTAPRFIEGFQRYDKVLYQGQECFIFGRRSAGYFNLRKLTGDIIHESAKVKDLKLLETFKTLLWEEVVSASFPYHKGRGFCRLVSYEI